MHYIIYKTTNKINGKFYIGAHKTPNINDNYLGSGKLLKKAIDKYGIVNFIKEVLFEYDTSYEMYIKEKELVNKELVENPLSYNLKIGGFGGWDHVDSKNKIVTTETKTKMSISAKKRQLGETNSFFGKEHTQESKTKIGKASKKRAKEQYEIRMKDGNHPNSQTTCPYCNKQGQKRALLRWHFSNCKVFRYLQCH